MTPRDLRNIQTPGNSCRDALPRTNMALKLPQYFYLLMEKPLGRYFQVCLLQAAQYPQGDRSGLGKPKKDKHHTNHSYHQRSSPSASLN